jgi:DHA3 family multidrug efflux protein-like MFS transporter
MAPLAESVFMPFMTDGRGAQWLGEWFGTGPDRGLALMFTIAGVLGVAATVVAWTSKSYRRLVATTAGPVDDVAPAIAAPLADCAA